MRGLTRGSGVQRNLRGHPQAANLPGLIVNPQSGILVVDQNGLVLHIGDDASLEQFIEAVGAFGALVGSVADAIPKHGTLRWKPDVRKGSIEVVAVPESSDHETAMTVTKAIVDGITAISLEATRPAYFNDDALKSVQKLAELDIDNRIGLNGAVTQFSATVAVNVKTYLETPAHAYGTVEGLLQRVSSRRGNQCAIYDQRLGYSVECSLTRELMSKALEAFDQRVLVYGYITYHNRRPQRVAVEKLETFPDPSTLPSADYVKGILRDDWVPPHERR